MSKPLCSVIMPVFNAAATLAASIQSVRQQTFSDWELIVVDDCSSDSTPEIVKDFAVMDPRIRYVRMDANSGGPAAPRNRGIKEAVGRYMAFLDGDDLWYCDKLKSQLIAMRDSGWPISCTGFDVLGSDGIVIGAYMPPIATDYAHALRENTLGCLSVVYDSEVLGKRYFPKLGHEDYALWLEILREGHLAHGLQQTLCAYRLTPGSVSRNKLRVLRFFFRIYRDREGFSAIQSLWLTIRYALYNAGKYRRIGGAGPARDVQ